MSAPAQARAAQSRKRRRTVPAPSRGQGRGLPAGWNDPGLRRRGPPGRESGRRRRDAAGSRMLIVFNPAAGARRRRRLRRALDALARLGLRPELAETERPGHATLLAGEAAGRGVALVVAAGGDGTIAEVAGGIAGSAAALGILPLGTANVLAWELGVPPAPERAAAVLATGRAAVLRPGFARYGDGTQRLFVQMLGAGFDAAVVHRLDLGLKRRLGRGAYVAQGMRELGRYPFPRFQAVL